MLRQVLPDERVRVVDLGCGDGSWGIDALRAFSGDGTPRAEMFIGVDISHDMLAHALEMGRERGEAGALLRSLVAHNGSVAGILGDFTRLRGFEGLLHSDASNLFLLMGNTIGNEANEEDTLRCIGSVMQSKDVLVVEYQEREQDPRSPAETEILLNEDAAVKEFLTGPLRALGAGPDQCSLVVSPGERWDDSVVAYNIGCKLARPIECRHPAFSDEVVTVPKGRIDVLVSRKYAADAIRAIWHSAGFDILSFIPSEHTSPHRRYGCVVARPKPTAFN